MSDITQHQSLAAQDYERLQEFNIRAVRESVGWRAVDRGEYYDFSSVRDRARAAHDHGIQVVWTLCHYGWPGHLDVLAPSFVGRFARYAGAVAEYLAQFAVGTPVYAPINEISFLAWAVCNSGRLHPSHADLKDRNQEFKRQLVRAAIAASDAIWRADPRARILHTDPLMHVVAPLDRPDLGAAAERQRERQFEAWIC